MSISAIFKVLLSLIFSAQFFIDHLTLPRTLLTEYVGCVNNGRFGSLLPNLPPSVAFYPQDILALSVGADLEARQILSSHNAILPNIPVGSMGSKIYLKGGLGKVCCSRSKVVAASMRRVCFPFVSLPNSIS